MDTVYAAGQSQTVASPVPVHDRRPVQGTVEKRAVESVTRGSTLNTFDRRPELEPEAPVVRLVRDFAYHLAATIERSESVETVQAQPGAAAVTDGAEDRNDHVDVYA